MSPDVLERVKGDWYPNERMETLIECFTLVMLWHVPYVNNGVTLLKGVVSLRGVVILLGRLCTLLKVVVILLGVLYN